MFPLTPLFSPQSVYTRIPLLSFYNIPLTILLSYLGALDISLAPKFLSPEYITLSFHYLFPNCYLFQSPYSMLHILLSYWATLSSQRGYLTSNAKAIDGLQFSWVKPVIFCTWQILTHSCRPSSIMALLGNFNQLSSF